MKVSPSLKFFLNNIFDHLGGFAGQANCSYQLGASQWAPPSSPTLKYYSSTMESKGILE